MTTTTLVIKGISLRSNSLKYNIITELQYIAQNWQIEKKRRGKPTTITDFNNPLSGINKVNN